MATWAIPRAEVDQTSRQDGKYQGMIVRQGSVDVQVAHGFSLTSILLESRKGNLLSDRVFFMTLQHES